MKQAQKWKFSSLMNLSAIFTQICPKLPLYTKLTKIKSIPGTSTFQIPKLEICKWSQPFSNFTQTDPKLSSISKYAKLKWAKKSKIKIHISEKHP